MQALATTLISVLRGTTTDTYGDPVDATTPVATNIPCSLLEQTDYVQTQDMSTPIIVRRYTGRVNGDVNIQVGDRILDQTTNNTYMVDAFTTSNHPLIVTDTKLNLRIVT